MKRKVFNQIKVFALLVLTLFVTNSCNDLLNNPMKDKETGEDLTLLLLDFNFFETKFTFHFVDSMGEYITDKNISVYLLGDDAANIVDYNGKKNDVYTPSKGRLGLAYDPNVRVTESDPVEFTVFVDVEDQSYEAIPVEVYFSEEGNYDVEVELFKTEELKSAVLSPGTEPFNVNFNNTLIKKNNDPVWKALSGVRYANGKSYYSVFRATLPPVGKLTSTNFTLNESLYKNWGLEGYYFISGDRKTKEFKLTNKEIEVKANTVSFKAYSATELKNVLRCTKGIFVNVHEKFNQTGTGNFKYKLLNGTDVVKTGRISFPSLPFTVNIGAFNYPASATSLKFKLEGDNQYTIETSEVNMTNFCGDTVKFVAKSKTGLVPYKIVISITCPGNVIGITPSMGGKFRVTGSQDPWTYFEFVQGTCTLLLNPGATYSVEGYLGDMTAEFDFPTDESKIDEAAEDLLESKKELEDIEYEFSETGNGKEIKIHAIFKDGDCPF